MENYENKLINMNNILINDDKYKKITKEYSETWNTLYNSLNEEQKKILLKLDELSNNLSSTELREVSSV